MSHSAEMCSEDLFDLCRGGCQQGSPLPMSRLGAVMPRDEGFDVPVDIQSEQDGRLILHGIGRGVRMPLETLPAGTEI